MIAGALSASTGLGEAARLAAEALDGLGEPVSLVDLTRALRQEPLVAPLKLPAAAAGSGTLLVFANPPVSALAFWSVPAALRENRRLVGCWVWEHEEAPRRWAEHARLFHEIAAPSRFAADAIARTIGQPVRLLPHPVAASPLRPRATRQDRPFTVGFIGDVVASAARKNPEGVVEAFARAQLPPNASRLRMHLHGPADAPEPPWLHEARRNGVQLDLTRGVMDRERIRALYGELDLYVSLHRAEGFGLTVAEAMLAGVPAAATDWSATAEFVDGSVGYPVPCRLVPSPPTVDDVRPSRWAEPDVAAAASLIRLAFACPDDRRARGARASEAMRRRFDGRAFLDLLEASRPPLGVQPSPPEGERASS